MIGEQTGITWNQRVADAGLLEEWDRAAKRGDRWEMLRILMCFDMSLGDAEKTVDAVLAKIQEYSGMTWNERLADAGLLEEWDSAAKRRDRSAMVRILTRVETRAGDAEKTVDAILTNPANFGL